MMRLLSLFIFASLSASLFTTRTQGHFSSSNTWSVTRKLLATKLPPTPQGAPVNTNIYDQRDWLIQTLDPLQKAVVFTNDAAGRLISVTDPLSQTSAFGYDADGRSTSATNGLGEMTTQQWDTRGKVTKTIDGAGHSVLHAFDSAGNQTILTNRNAKKWQFQFDAANRLTNTITPMGRSNSVVLDSRGLVASTKDPAGQTTTFSYDAKRRLTRRADLAGTNTYSYDPNDNLTNVTEASQTNTWIYDAYNRVSSYRDSAGNLIQYRYDNNGNLTNLIYPGGRIVSYAYDSLNRMTNVTDWTTQKTSFTYDLASRLTTISRPNGTVRTIGYDPAGQVTNVLEQTSIGFPILLFRLDYDAANRAKWEFLAPPPHVTNFATRTMTYDDDNRLVTFKGPTMGTAQSVTMDANGNMTSGSVTNDTFATYTYDARNRLSSIGSLTNGYDPAGNRTTLISGANATTFVIDPNASLSQVLMRVKGGTTNYYIYGLGLLYEVTETATTTNALTYHYDYRGSTVALTDNNGNPKERFEYSAYGSLTYRSGTTDTPFLYNGRYGVQSDPNGLLYMRARYYNPYLCRFINADPSGFGGGLNMYAYANGNPVSLIDPFGLGAVGDFSSRGISWLGGASLNDLAGSLLNIAFNVATLPVGMAFGEASAINTAISGQDDAGNQVSGLSRTWATISAVAPFVPIADVESVASRVVTGLGTEAAESGTTLYRGLAEGESIANGLVARAPGAGNDVISHVAGQRASQWISTTRSLEIAQQRFGQFGVVAVDMSRVTTPIVDVSAGLPGLPNNFMLPRWARATQEVLIQDRVPAEAVRLISGPR